MFCPNICGHSYKGKYRKHNLKRHMMLSCRVHAQFECTFCQKRFRSNQILKTITQIRFLEKIHCLVQMVVADCTELRSGIRILKNIVCFVQIMAVADRISGKTAQTI
ncbi:uncharacterized protein LOC111042499 isoform X1 [Myzus persicae]|uniref:uncharacterized protein LOC111042499 isoform X1 n=1 Tax=Myzus persicae TaxID=13164 RepID=UPI000B9318E8|nr:uncharacterized protein LOC111042499 isoform X1 [Myzus persicae]